MLRHYWLHRSLLINDWVLLGGLACLGSEVGRRSCGCGCKLIVCGGRSCCVIAILTTIVNEDGKRFLLQNSHGSIQDLGKRHLAVGRLAELVWREIVALRLIILI